MNIAIDITHYNKLSGFGIVTENIVKGLLEKDKNNFYYLFACDDKNLENLQDFKNFKFINTRENFTKYKFFSLPKYLKENNIDVFLSLDQTLPFKKVCKYIVVEHDIGMQRLGKTRLIKELFSKNWLLSVYHLIDIEKITLKKADKIITPSEYVKKDIIDYYKLDDKKIIEVINWGIDHLEKDENIKKEDYILFPYTHENIFVEELAKKLIEEKLAQKIIFLRYSKDFEDEKISNINKAISRKENIDYYSKALLSIYISFNEGFGIVPLESMFYGTPIIFNKNTCLEEISGGGGIMIDNLDIDLFIENIKKLISDNNYYQDIVKKGYEHIKKYNWDKSIEKILEIII